MYYVRIVRCDPYKDKSQHGGEFASHGGRWRKSLIASASHDVVLQD